MSNPDNVTETPAKASDHGIAADDRIELRNDFDHGRLHARLLELSGLRLQTLAERAELAAIVRLMSNFHVTADEVWDLLLCFNHIGDNNEIDSDYEGGWLDPLHSDLATAWRNLQNVLAGIPVTEQPPGEDSDYTNPDYNEAYYAWTERQNEHTKAWYIDMMRQMASCLGMSGSLSSSDLTVHLPYELVQAVWHDYDSIWRSSPMTVGASLCELPTYSRFFGHQNGPALLKVLALTVQLALKACHEIEDTEQYAEMLGLLDLHWQFLKGFTYAVTEDSEFLSWLPGHMDTVDLVVDSLSRGLSRLRDASVEPTPEWGGHIYELDNKIRYTHTSDLVPRLIERVSKHAETYGMTAL